MRKIRIQGKVGDVRGRFVQLTNADTGEIIPRVLRATIHLDACGLNTVDLVYADDQFIEQTVVEEVSEINLTAMA